MKGEVKKHEQKECHYGLDGKVQKTPVPVAAADTQQPPAGEQPRGGRLKRTPSLNTKSKEMNDYMGRVAALVHEYVSPVIKLPDE